MKILIVFIGLIVQVNQPGTLLNSAVLPSGGSHNPHIATLEIPYDAIENPDPSMRDRVENGHVVFDLSGVHLTVDGTRGMFSKMSGELKEALPPLKRLAPGCVLRDEVRERRPTADLHAFVDFRGGRRTVDTYLQRTLTFKQIGWTDRCVACGVRYEAGLRGETATLRLMKGNESREIRVKAGAKIIVRNTPENPKQRHFQHVFDIYENCPPPATAIPLPQTKPCPKQALCEGMLMGGRPTAPGDDCTGGNG